jgi:elongation factor 2
MNIPSKIADKLRAGVNVSQKIRNIAIIAHVDHGKTTLTDSLLAGGKLINEETAGTQLFTDFDKEEKERGITINTCNISFSYEIEENNKKEPYLFNLADTPGHADFSGEVVRILRGVEGVLLIVDAVEGIKPQTEVVIKHSLNQNNKMILVINKVDRLFNELLFDYSKIKDILFNLIEDINVFISSVTSEENFKKYADFSFKKPNVILSSGIEKWAINTLILEEKGEKFSDFLKNYNTQGYTQKYPLCPTVLRTIKEVIPSPVEGLLEKRDHLFLSSKPKENRKTVAVVGLINDKFIGNLSVVKLIEGTLSKNDTLFNFRTNKFNKISKIFLVMAEDKLEVNDCSKGNLIALLGTEGVKIGDMLSTDCELNPIITQNTSEPILSIAIRPATREDKKLGPSIKKLLSADLNLSSTYNEETGQYLLGGIGDLHLETTITKLKNYFGVEVISTAPEIIYRESLKAESISIEEISANRHNRFRCRVFMLNEEIVESLSGEFLEVKSKVDFLIKKGIPKEVAKGYEKVFGRNLFFNCTKGIQYYDEIKDLYHQCINSALQRGPLRKKKIQRCGIIFEDARIHETPLHRGIAQVNPMIRKAIHGTILQANPVILEPYNQITLYFPEEFFNKVKHELLRRRGKINTQEFDEGYLTLGGVIPCNELAGMNKSLMESTEGKINWSQSFYRFEILPSILLEQKIPSPKETK